MIRWESGWEFVCDDCCHREDTLYEPDPAYRPGGSKWHADGDGHSR
jgi:hypothetical protein